MKPHDSLGGDDGGKSLYFLSRKPWVTPGGGTKINDVHMVKFYLTDVALKPHNVPVWICGRLTSL